MTFLTGQSLHTCAGDCFSLLAAKLNELPMFSRKFWNSFGGSIFGISEFEGFGFLGGRAGGEVGRGSTTSDFEDASYFKAGPFTFVGLFCCSIQYTEAPLNSFLVIVTSLEQLSLAEFCSE